jgi:hypothetical protein
MYLVRKLHSLRSILVCLISILGLASAGITSITLSNPAHASAASLPAYKYTKTFDSTNGQVDGSAVKTDSSGNVYVVGQFNGTVIFDGPGGSDSETALNGETFLTKFNANGTYGWTRVFDDTTMFDISDGSGVAIDSSGNVYITGSFLGTVIFDGVGGSHSLTANATTSYVAKFSTNGDYEWAKTFDTNSGSSSYAQDIAINSSGDIYIAGIFNGTVTFDGAGGSHNQTTANNDSFVTEYSPDGAYQWTRTADASASGAYIEPMRLAVDSSGNVYVVGWWGGTIVFDGVGGNNSQTVSQSQAAFITKYSANGAYDWTKVTYNSVLNAFTGANSVATDKNGNVYIAGSFRGTVLFDGPGGSDSQTDPVTSSAAYLTKINANGTYGWTRINDTSSSGSFSDGAEVATDYDGSVYYSGSFWGTVVFDGPGGSDSQTSANEATFLTKINASGTYQWTSITDPVSSGAMSLPQGLAADNDGNVYVLGRWHGNVVFDGDGGSDSQTTSVYSVYLSSFQAFTPPPVIFSQTSSVTSGSSVTVNVLAGATGNPDPNSVTIVTPPLHGTAYDPPGTITYTPNKGYAGPDSLTYRVCSLNDAFACSEAQLSFTVLKGPLAPDTGFGTPGSQNTGYRELSVMPIKSVATYILASFSLVTTGFILRRHSKQSHYGH